MCSRRMGRAGGFNEPFICSRRAENFSPREQEPLIRLRHLLPSRGEKANKGSFSRDARFVALLPAMSGEKVALSERSESKGRMRGCDAANSEVRAFGCGYVAPV